MPTASQKPRAHLGVYQRVPLSSKNNIPRFPDTPWPVRVSFYKPQDSLHFLDFIFGDYLRFFLLLFTRYTKPKHLLLGVLIYLVAKLLLGLVVFNCCHHLQLPRYPPNQRHLLSTFLFDLLYVRQKKKSSRDRAKKKTTRKGKETV